MAGAGYGVTERAANSKGDKAEILSLQQLFNLFVDSWSSQTPVNECFPYMQAVKKAS